MTSDDKDNIIFEVTNGYINEFERELSERINSTEFKMELKRRLEKQNVQIDFVNMNNTETFHDITIDKYSVFVCEDFYDDLNKDIVIH